MGKRRQSLRSRFESLDAFYQSGFCLQSDIHEPVLIQQWTQELERQELSISTLSTLTGISRQSLGRLAERKTMPTVETALRIAEALQCDINSLFGLSPEGQYYLPFRKQTGVAVYLNKLTLTTHTSHEVIHFEQSGYNWYNSSTDKCCNETDNNATKIFEQIFYLIKRHL